MTATLLVGSIADKFPVGTSVGAYARSDWPSTEAPAGAPPGSAVASANVAADGSLSIAGLAYDTRYVLGASVGGVWRYVNAKTAPDPASSSVTHADLDAEAALLQPLDSDLTAVAALATTAYGRGLLALADAAALRAAAGISSSPDLSGVYRRLYSSSFGIAAANITDATERGFTSVATALAAAPGGVISSVSIKAADWVVAGKDPKLRLGVDVETGDTQIGTTLTLNLKRQTGVSGATTPITRALDAAATTCVINNPAAGSHPARIESEIDLPADGLYVFTITPGAAFAANSYLQGNYFVDVRNV